MRTRKDALRALAAETDSEKREELLLALLSRVPDEDLVATLDDLRVLDGNESADELTIRLLRRWSERDAAAAAAWTNKLPAGETRLRAVENIATAWANRSVSAAAEWALRLSAEESQRALAQIAHEAVRAQPRAALLLIDELWTSPARDDLVVRAAAEWAARSAREALAWAGQIADPALRERAISAIAVAASEVDPTGAAHLAIAALSAGRPQADAIVGIVQRWAQTDPVAAHAWVATFPPGALRETALDVMAEPSRPKARGQPL